MQAHRTPAPDVTGHVLSSVVDPALIPLLKGALSCFCWLACSMHGPQQESGGTPVSRRERVHERGAEGPAASAASLLLPYPSVPTPSRGRSRFVQVRVRRQHPPRPCATPPAWGGSPMERGSCGSGGPSASPGERPLPTGFSEGLPSLPLHLTTWPSGSIAQKMGLESRA